MAYAFKKASAKPNSGSAKPNNGPGRGRVMGVKKTGGGGGGWGTAKRKMKIPTPIDPKQTEQEFKSAVLKMMKSENSLALMEERSKKKKAPREKTEFEIVKERLKHIEFSDEEKGFLSPEQMEIVKNGVMGAKDELTEMEREGKGNGQYLDSYILKFSAWQIEIKELKEMGINIDLSNLLQARKRSIIRNLFYDPQADEKRRLAMEEAERQRKLREEELEKQKLKQEEERLGKLEKEKNKLKLMREEADKQVREEEKEKKRKLEEEDDRLDRYEQESRRKQDQIDAQRAESEKEASSKRLQLLRKFSTSEAPVLDDDGVDSDQVGEGNAFSKDKITGLGLERAGRRKSVGKLSNPFADKPGQGPGAKQKSRRMSKVGKLNSPFEDTLSENQEVKSFSRGSSRRSSVVDSGSQSPSRKSSLSDSSPEGTGSSTSDAFMTEVNYAMKGLADLAANASNFAEEPDDNQYNYNPSSTGNASDDSN